MSLYTRHGYLNKDIVYLVSNEIIEYDMVSAGLSLTKMFKLLDEDTISYLEKLPKQNRNIEMGLMQRKDKEYAKALSEAFVQGRKLFFEANDLNLDNVLSIKKDAIYTTKHCFNLDFGELQFAPKNEYTSYYNFNRYEFYYSSNGIDVKGISEEKLLLHIEYMLGAIYDYMYLQETSPRERVIRYVKDLSMAYKAMKLETGYYRELNNDSLYRIKYMTDEYSFGVQDVEDKSIILTNYNFNNYIIPMTQILL